MFPPDNPSIRAALVGTALCVALLARQFAGYSRTHNDRRGNHAAILAAVAGVIFGLALAPW